MNGWTVAFQTLLKQALSEQMLALLRWFRHQMQVAVIRARSGRVVQHLQTRVYLWRNRRQSGRKLEIGPGHFRIPGFETLSLDPGSHVDYVCDASARLPFPSSTFEIIYASHVLEHIPWYLTEQVLIEWVRVLSPRGRLEVWVPDALKICRVLLDAEVEGKDNTHLDGWYKFNPEKDPCVWAAGRMYTYGDGTGNLYSPNWHRALFTHRYLRKLIESAGLKDVRELSSTEVRGYNHGWISLGMTGRKP